MDTIRKFVSRTVLWLFEETYILNIVWITWILIVIMWTYLLITARGL